MSRDHCSGREDNDVITCKWHATKLVNVYEIDFINITPRSLNIEMDVSWCGCKALCSRVENHNQLDKTFDLSL